MANALGPTAQIIEFPPNSPRALYPQARLSRQERTKTGGRFGDLGAPQLQQILDNASKGDTWDWVDLCQFILGTDPDVFSAYDTRISRVVQADWVISPNPDGDPHYANMACELVNELFPRIRNWKQAQRDLLHALAPGFAASEMEWQRDSVKKVWFCPQLHQRHGHIFRFDEQWQPRLYKGDPRYTREDRQGELLDPQKWIVHYHRPVNAYPGDGGLMRPCAYLWMFGRWVTKWFVGYAERFGGPFMYGKVPPNSVAAVRAQMLEDLQNLSNEHVGVVEAGTEIIIESGGSDTEGAIHETFLNRVTAAIDKVWLGATDISDPGEHGSQSAVDTRTSAVTDPRMVSDGNAFWGTIQESLFRQYIYLNAHKFGCPVDHVPIPIATYKTADDEAHQDPGDKADELAVQGQPGQLPANGVAPVVGLGMEQQPPVGVAPTAPAPVAPMPVAPPPAPMDIQKSALAAGQIKSLLDIVKSVAAEEIPRDAGVEMITTAFPVDRATAERIMGTAGTPMFAPAPPPPSPFGPPPGADPEAPTEPPPKPDKPEPEPPKDEPKPEPEKPMEANPVPQSPFFAETPPEPAPDPKAPAPMGSGQWWTTSPTTATPQTTSHSQSPFALASAGALAGSAPSSPKARSARSKR